MRSGKLFSLTSIFILFCSIAYAQATSTTPQPSDTSSETDAAKKKNELDERIIQMLDRAVADGNALRLSQNKALIYAIAGDLYWKFDEKRARELFRSATSEIITYNAETEKEQAQQNNNGQRGGFQPPNQDDPRPQVLPLVAAHDAELAYQMLFQTRSQSLAAAMLKAAQPGSAQTNARGGGNGGGQGGGRGANFDPMSQEVAQEVTLEQQFALLAAANDPDASIKLIKDSLSNGISCNVLPALQNLFKKDEKKAGELAGDVIGNLTGTN